MATSKSDKAKKKYKMTYSEKIDAIMNVPLVDDPKKCKNGSSYDPRKNLSFFKSNPELLADPEVSNAKMAAFMIEVMRIRTQADTKNIDTLYACLREYIELCANANMKLSNLMAYNACGVTKQIVDAWVSGRARNTDPRYKEFANTVKAICASTREQLANEGKINPVFAIWQQKVHDGFRDNEIVTEAEEVEHIASSEEIAQKYSDLDLD